MKRSLMFIVLATLAQSTWANQYIIYPAGGQDAEQQKADTRECQTWATDNTGVDPIALASQPVTTTGSSEGGSALGGAVGGAALGAAIGAIAGDAGDGAAIGAGLGLVRGSNKQRRAQDNQQEQMANAQAERDQMMGTFNRAFKACMEGRDYQLN
ncbi:glycine zipper family protein [Ferrimonas aestuarii]|uniref:Glycine-zipper-containing OmpA-like membrane domain-containing protein n=1 Tax=Ferrimonas aestuarii TaxID=2569539 RepID=A0A4U1BQA2_9GAMM|nr:glycine zipper family protein [Ferrimonas aestuarii]TKB56586.1 hypothetical protein FCL42_05485 [Ferrimonas aestuarii]